MYSDVVLALTTRQIIESEQNRNKLVGSEINHVKQHLQQNNKNKPSSSSSSFLNNNFVAQKPNGLTKTTVITHTIDSAASVSSSSVSVAQTTNSNNNSKKKHNNHQVNNRKRYHSHNNNKKVLTDQQQQQTKQQIEESIILTSSSSSQPPTPPPLQQIVSKISGIEVMSNLPPTSSTIQQSNSQEQIKSSTSIAGTVTTVSNQVTSPSTYSLDFLHFVGDQITANNLSSLSSAVPNIPIIDITSPPSLAAMTNEPTQIDEGNRRHSSNFNYNTIRHHQHNNNIESSSSGGGGGSLAATIFGYSPIQTGGSGYHNSSGYHQNNHTFSSKFHNTNNSYDCRNYGNFSRKYCNPSYYQQKFIKKNVPPTSYNNNQRSGGGNNCGVIGDKRNVSPTPMLGSSANNTTNTNSNHTMPPRLSYSTVASSPSPTSQIRDTKSVSPTYHQNIMAPISLSSTTNLLSNQFLATSLPAIDTRSSSSSSSSSYRYDADYLHVNYNQNASSKNSTSPSSVQSFNYLSSSPDLTKLPPVVVSPVGGATAATSSSSSSFLPSMSRHIGYYSSQQNLSVWQQQQHHYQQHQNSKNFVALNFPTNEKNDCLPNNSSTIGLSAGIGNSNRNSNEQRGEFQQHTRGHIGRNSPPNNSKTFRSVGHRNKNKAHSNTHLQLPLTTSSSTSTSSLTPSASITSSLSSTPSSSSTTSTLTTASAASKPHSTSSNRHSNASGGDSYIHQHLYTPPDRFLNRSHLVETKTKPENLLNGSDWDGLSQMIWDKFIGAQQSEETYKKKMYLWRYLYSCVKKMYPRYGLYLVGSTISGFGADTSDVDMCLVSRFITEYDPRLEAMMHLKHLQEHLAISKIFDSFHLIQAKVPILRFKDTLHLLEVDLNFNNSVGIRNTHLLHCYSQMDWRLRPLALVVKLWAHFHNINNAKDMTISSYSLVLMTIHFLQYSVSPAILPCLHAMYPQKFQKLHDINTIDMNEELEPFHSENKQTLGELFLQFLGYYSSFNYAQHAISVRTASVIPIVNCRLVPSPKNDPHQWKELCIEEPFDFTNTARSVYDAETFHRIKDVFITSFHRLKETMNLNLLFETSFLQPPRPLSCFTINTTES